MMNKGIILLITVFWILVMVQFSPAAETDVVINEIMYHPGASNTGGEYIELYNRGSSTVALNGWKLANAITYTFPAVSIQAGSYLVVCNQPLDATLYYGISNPLGPYGGQLSNGGETIQLFNNINVLIDEVSYSDAWPWWSEADGAGPSLELINSYADNNNASNWGLGNNYSPAGINTALIPPAAGAVVINEIMYDPGPENTGDEYVEIYNRSGSQVDMSGWTLSEAVTFTFPLGTMLAADDYLVIVADEPNALSYTPYGLSLSDIAGQYSGELNNDGELIVLKDDGGQIVDVVNYNDNPPWPSEPDGSGPSLELFISDNSNNDPANWGIGRLFTPAAGNDPVPSGGGDIVITEIMYKPLKNVWMETLDADHRGVDNCFYWETSDDPQGAYVELYNRGDSPVDLTGWSFNDGINFVFTSGPILQSGEYCVVAQSAAALASHYGISNAIGDFTLNLSDNGERITLVDDSGIVMDTVRYRDEPPWPIAPDQTGRSLECMDPDLDNNDAANWRACQTDWSCGECDECSEPYVTTDRSYVGTEYFVCRGTPGTVNSVSTAGLPPFIDRRDIKHTPRKPTSGDELTVTALVESNDTITNVTLDYQVYVAPYNSPSQSNSIPMYDDGDLVLHGDDVAGDRIYSVKLPAETSQTLVRYRVTVADNNARTWTYPDSVEPNPNIAYFVWDGEGKTKMDPYFLLVPQSTLDALNANIWTKTYYDATLVYKGIVYDHVGIHYRGRGLRTAAKKSWKVAFNKTEYLRNMSALDLKGVYPFKEKFCFDMYGILGQENLCTELLRLYLNGNFHGIYIGQDSPSLSWLQERGIAQDGEIYKAEVTHCWTEPFCLGGGYLSDLTYHDDPPVMEPVGIFPRLYTRRSDPLLPFDNLIDFTYNLTTLPDADLDECTEATMDLDKWMYHWMVHLCGGHGDWWGNNYFAVLTYDEFGQPDKWKPYEFDFDHMFGCWGGGGSIFCPSYNTDPWYVGTKFHLRCANNPELRNRMKTVLNDVLTYYWREDVMFAELDWLLKEYDEDRQDDIARWGENFVTSDSTWDALKTYFTNRRNYLLNWLAGDGIPTLANEHPTIELGNIVVNIDNNIVNTVEIHWNSNDAEGDASLVDLYWTDRKWSGFRLIDTNISDSNNIYIWTANIPDFSDKKIWIHAKIHDGVSSLNGYDIKRVEYCGQTGTLYMVSDINRDCFVNMMDLVQWVDDWLICTDPFNPGVCSVFLAAGMDEQIGGSFDQIEEIQGGVVAASVIDLLAHWAFETTGPGANQTPDSLGVHPADLIPGGGQPALVPGGAMGNAMQIDVLGEYATAQDPTGGLSIGTGDGTIALWVRHDGPTFGEAVYIEKLDPAGGRGWTLYSLPANSHKEVEFYVHGIGPVAFDTTYLTPGLDIDDGAWHHIALTKTANAGAGVDEVRLYIDGLAMQAAGKPGGVTVQTHPLNSQWDVVGSAVWMGKRNPAPWGQNIGINGALDEARIYNTALSQSEIQDLMVPRPNVIIVEEGGSAMVTEGGASDSYTVVLTQAPSGDNAVVSINTDDDVDVDPALLIFTDLNWDQEQTVTVSAVDDLLSEGPEISTITHTVTGGGYDGVVVRDVLVYVIDNEEYCGQPGTEFLVSDLNLDCYVDMWDFAILAMEWMQCTDPAYPDDCYVE